MYKINFIKICILFLFGLVIFNNHSFAQNFKWSKNTGSTDADIGNDVVVDSFGNIYTTGYFVGTVSFGGKTVISNGSSDIFLAKYNKNGQTLWVKKFGGTASDVGVSVKLDYSGNVILAGHYSGTVLFGSKTFTSLGNYDGFFAKLDTAGTVLIAGTGGGVGSDYITEVDVDKDGNIYMIGSYEVSVTYSGNTINSNGSNDLYLVKFDKDGNFNWIQNMGGTLVDEIEGLAVDKNGNAFVVGCVFKSATIGSKVLTGTISTGKDIFMAQFDAFGNTVWAKRFGGSASEWPLSITLDSLNNIYTCGILFGSADLGGVYVSGSSKGDIYFAKYSSTGALQWAKSAAGSGADAANDIVWDPLTGHLYFTGYFAGTVNFEGNTLSSNSGTADIFIASYSSNGDFRWIQKGGGAGYDSPSAIDVNSSGNSVIVGRSNASLTLGTMALTNNGDNDIFLFSLGENSNKITGKLYVDTNNNGIQDANEYLYTSSVVAATPGPLYSISNSGKFVIYAANPGAYTITLPEIPKYYQLFPNQHTANFTLSGQTDSLNNFRLVPIPSANDLAIFHFSNGVMRPGNEVVYYVSYSNVGLTTLSGTVDFNFPSTLEYSSSSTSGTVSGNSISFPFTNIEPNSTEQIVIKFNVSTTATLGSAIESIAKINPITGDLYPDNNVHKRKAFVVTSLDPNYKEVSQTQLEPVEISAQPYLEYIIHFQNVGLDTAFNVRIEDLLSAKLYMPSFEVLSSSHKFNYCLSENGKIEFTFDNIKLPSDAVNYLESNGYVSYRIKPQTTLALGDKILNTAGIYFDYNSAVITNTVQTEVVSIATSTTSVLTSSLIISIYPNPITTGFQYDLNTSISGELQVVILSSEGRIVYKQISQKTAQIHSEYIFPANLNPGMYLVQFKLGDESYSSKIIIE